LGHTIESRASVEREISTVLRRSFQNKRGAILRVRYRETIADNLGNAGWSWGCVSGVCSRGRTCIAATERISLCVRMKSRFSGP